MQVFSTYMHLKAASAGIAAGQATSIGAEESSANTLQLVTAHILSW